MVEWKPILIGFLVALFLGIILGFIIPLVGSALAMMLAGIIVGYLVKKEPLDGLTHGAIMGVISGLFLGLKALLGVTILGTLFGVGLFAGIVGFILVIILVIIGAVFGAVGGVIGVIISAGEKKKILESNKGEIMQEPIDITPTPKEPVIEFSIDNILKCLCSNCPVQEKSKCSSEKLLKMQEILNSEKVVVKADDVPGLHCATGQAVCQDLDFEEKCQCVECPIWDENSLENNKPMDSFCHYGKSH